MKISRARCHHPLVPVKRYGVLTMVVITSLHTLVICTFKLFFFSEYKRGIVVYTRKQKEPHIIQRRTALNDTWHLFVFRQIFHIFVGRAKEEGAKVQSEAVPLCRWRPSW